MEKESQVTPVNPGLTPADAELQPFGWAPGHYTCVCRNCAKMHAGADKRSNFCRPCAVESREKHLAKAPPESPKGRDALRLAAQAVCDAATLGDCKSELSQQLNTTICKVPSKLIRDLEVALEALPPE